MRIARSSLVSLACVWCGPTEAFRVNLPKTKSDCALICNITGIYDRDIFWAAFPQIEFPALPKHVGDDAVNDS